MKKVAFIAAAVGMFLFLQTTCAADDAPAENALADYSALQWSGDPLYYDSASQTLFFRHNEDKKIQDAYFTVCLPTGSPAGFMFYADIGNGSSADGGEVVISFYDDDARLLSLKSGVVSDSGNYRRCSAGSEEEYYSVPEGAKYLTVNLSASDNDGSGTVDAYFRNLYVVFANTEKTAEIPEDYSLMQQSGALTKVEIGDKGFSRLLWIALVFAVAMIFYVIRVVRQKYKTGGIIKPKKTYEK